MTHKKSIIYLILLSSFLSIVHAKPKSIEVLHWWTSGGEARAIDVLKQEMERQGYQWKNGGSVMGGGGEQQRLVIKARINANTPPDAMLIQGNIIKNYTENNLLSNLDTLAAKEHWGKIIPEPLQKIVKINHHWMAVPINIHRSHWIWANKKIFDKLHITPPKSFPEFMSVADKIKKAGYIPLAHGGQSWQDAILFDSAVLSVGGISFYKKALVDLDKTALKSDTMKKVFEQLKQLRSIIDKDFLAREWNLATAMVIHEKAAMQIMGDWVKGEFIKAGKKPNKDFLCFEYPGTQGNFLFISDTFGMLNAPKNQLLSQQILATTMMDKTFQEKFNRVKGSIPSRLDINSESFDDCAQKSYNDFKLSLKNNTVLQRFDTNIPSEKRIIIFNIVSRFFQKNNQSPEDAVKTLAWIIASKSRVLYPYPMRAVKH